MNNKILLPFIALCLIWGSTWYYIAISMDGTGMTPAFGVGFRFFLSGIIFLLFCRYKKLKIPFSKQAIRLYLSFGLLNFSLSYYYSYWAVINIASSISAILWASFPLFTSVMAHYMIKDSPDEKFNRNKLYAIIIGLIGVSIICYEQGINLQTESLLSSLTLIGVIIVAAYPSVQYKKHNDEVGPFEMNAVCQILCGIVMLSFSFLKGDDLSDIKWIVDGEPWYNSLMFATSYLVILGGFISWGIYFWLYKYLNVTQVTYVAIFPPIVAIIIGYLFLQEDLSGLEYCGTILILSSAILIYRK
tara:strand:+ start:1386 stop:2291 length:906 start_codon:yes stop_codon:yes gene_type:complete